MTGSEPVAAVLRLFQFAETAQAPAETLAPSREPQTAEQLSAAHRLEIEQLEDAMGLLEFALIGNAPAEDEDAAEPAADALAAVCGAARALLGRGTAETALRISDAQYISEERTMCVKVTVEGLDLFAHDERNKRVLGIAAGSHALKEFAYPSYPVLAAVVALVEATIGHLIRDVREGSPAADPGIDFLVFRVFAASTRGHFTTSAIPRGLRRHFRRTPFFLGWVRFPIFLGDGNRGSSPERVLAGSKILGDPYPLVEAFTDDMVGDPLPASVLALHQAAVFAVADFSDPAAASLPLPPRGAALRPAYEPRVRTMRGCFHRPCRYVGPNLSRCTRCRVAWYCGPFCQKTDWPRHRAFCGHGKPADAEPHHRFNRPVGYGVDEIADQLGEFGIHDVSPWSLLRENPRRTQYRSMGEDVEDDGVVEGLEDLVGEPVSDSDDYREEGEEHLQLEDLAGGAD